MKRVLWFLIGILLSTPLLAYGQTVTVDPTVNRFQWTQPQGASDGSQDPDTFTMTCGTVIKTGLGPYVSGTSTYSTLVGSVISAPGTYPCTVKAVNIAGESAPSNTVTILIPAMYQLTVSKKGQGTITSNVGGINCGSVCNASYTSGTVVTLTAVAASGYTFKGWSGACSGTGACSVTMTDVKSVTAQWIGRPLSPSLTVP